MIFIYAQFIEHPTHLCNGGDSMKLLYNLYKIKRYKLKSLITTK